MLVSRCSTSTDIALSIFWFSYSLKLEVETTLRQETEAKFNLVTSSLEKKVKNLEQKNAELKAVSSYGVIYRFKSFSKTH